VRLLDWVIVGLVPAAYLQAAFVLGAAVGSGLNVLIYRLPRGKSPLWPPSSCGVCLHPIRWHDNIPILGYLRLRGRCRDCGTRFSPRYMVVELVTGLGFAGLLGLEVFANVHDLPALAHRRASGSDIPAAVWVWYLAHVYLFCLAVVQFCCRLDGEVLPLPVALPGLLAGPLAAVLCPWPWPNEPPYSGSVRYTGLQLEPLKDPPPDWLREGSAALGLAGWVTGVAAAWLLIRGSRLPDGGQLDRTASGDLLFLMTVGGLLGWQAVVVTAVLALLPTAAVALAARRDLPYGAWLAVSAVVTLVAWHWLGLPFRPKVLS
jgi:leader peptidase (prepilin peptidase) / N-methyltransferase